MKSLYLNNIKEYVKARLDELDNNEEAMLVASDDAVEDLDKQIEKAVLPSVRKIHLDAPNVLLRDGYRFKNQPVCEGNTGTAVGENERLVANPSLLIFPPEGGVQNVNVSVVHDETTWSVDVTSGALSVVYNTENYKYYLPVPEDFLRLITLQMSGWVRPIQTLINEDSAEYRKQANPYLKGTPSRPVGALVHQNGTPMIELYTCDTNVAVLTYGQYVPEPAINTDLNGRYVEVCSPLEYPCLNQITAEVLRGIGRVQEAALYDAKAVQPFYIDPDYARLNPPVGERFNTNK